MESIQLYDNLNVLYHGTYLYSSTTLFVLLTMTMLFSCYHNFNFVPYPVYIEGRVIDFSLPAGGFVVLNTFYSFSHAVSIYNDVT